MFTPTAVQQQMFSLAWLITTAADDSQTAEQLQSALNAMSDNIGTWTIVWGPCYYTPEGTDDVANGIFVAQNSDTDNPVYAVAVAATNAVSSYDWMTEDMNATPLDWPYVASNPNSMQVTTGDNIGLGLLLAMSSGTNNTLQDFLASISNQSKTALWFTGHSLGGALAPMLTLALMDPNSTLNTSNDVSIGNWSSVSLQATAGPSIGNQAFVDYFFSTLSPSVGTSSFIWNGNDVIPHAWNSATMNAITQPNNIYGLNLSPTQCMAITLKNLQTTAAAQSYQIFQPTPAFSGPLSPYEQSSMWTPEAQFLAQMAYQHGIAYSTAFGCTWLPTGIDFCQSPFEAGLVLAEFNADVCPSS